ncbi:hypothetical protein LG943_03685 [Streptomonospora sp. S1-112]|uniref:Uncharacterized protein n=1 Tax=Streptomonospora mangrovi TaxID=2883123 RepID=A0A9X3NGS7_9ACTN|nr:hypothetical protein [Streptomonospora mangrovi]MDA0563434.1 hypothetical protein [Streptomonospora mangrovi]
MSGVYAIRYPDGTIHVPAAFADPAGPVIACGMDVLSPGDAGYDFYAAHAVSAEEYEEHRRDDPAESARLRAEFRKWYEARHGRRSA